MSWIYIVAVIIFAIVSNVNKAKGKGKPGKGMPTFGGGGESEPPVRRAEHEAEAERSGFPASAEPEMPRHSRGLPVEEREPEVFIPAYQEQEWRPGPDAETGEGVSLEQGDAAAYGDIRMAQMRQELDRVHAALDAIGGEADHGGDVQPARQDSAGKAASAALAGSREDLRRGLLWAEVLGPPRSRRPHSYRRES